MDTRETKFISLHRAHEASGVDRRLLTRLCRVGRLECQRVGEEWYIAEAEVLRLVEGKVDLRVSKIAPARLQRSLVEFLAIILLVAGLTVAGQTVKASAFFESLHETFRPAALGSFATELESLVGAITGSAQVSWSDVPATWDYIRDRAATNWRDFLGMTPPPSAPLPFASSTASTTLPSLNAEAVEEFINAQVESEIRSLYGAFTSGRGAGGQAGGLVVVPTTGDRAADELLKERIRRAFSDRVTVEFDPGGTTGVITPIFQQAPSREYLFLLTPITQ